ncbi:MAG: hypothetical protein HKN79_10025, partial [Flavobacteriales bacterium]|nr:hypothetical protein [Flavobacteriales bacterium]
MGGVRISGGELTMDGTVHGPSRLSAEDLTFGEKARFHADVHYWRENGEQDLNGKMLTGTAFFDESMAWEAND